MNETTWNVFLVAPPGMDVDSFLARIGDAFQLELGPYGGAKLWGGKTPMILYREGPFFEDDEELCDTYREIIPTFDPAVWGVVGVEFDDIAACRHLLMILADDPRLIVDCDNGYVARGDAFLARCRREPHWDWRQEDG